MKNNSSVIQYVSSRLSISSHLFVERLVNGFARIKRNGINISNSRVASHINASSASQRDHRENGAPKPKPFYAALLLVDNDSRASFIFYALASSIIHALNNARLFRPRARYFISLARGCAATVSLHQFGRNYITHLCVSVWDMWPVTALWKSPSRHRDARCVLYTHRCYHGWIHTLFFSFMQNTAPHVPSTMVSWRLWANGLKFMRSFSSP